MIRLVRVQFAPQSPVFGTARKFGGLGPLTPDP